VFEQKGVVNNVYVCNVHKAYSWSKSTVAPKEEKGRTYSGNKQGITLLSVMGKDSFPSDLISFSGQRHQQNACCVFTRPVA
jgi:hypothetical protein